MSNIRETFADCLDSEKEELDIQLRAVPDIEQRIAELTAA
jgi:hypothetical protein